MRGNGKIGFAVIGLGAIAQSSVLPAFDRSKKAGLAAVVSRDKKKAEEISRKFGARACYSNDEYDECLANPEVDAVYVATPPGTHREFTVRAAEAGKHVLCEKPLAMNAAEARELAGLAKAKNLAHCVNHNLRCYPQVQQMRAMIAAGELGEVLVVNGTYFQDWLLYDTDWNWRADSSANGALRAMGDIGSHWMDAIEHLTALRITSLCADLQTFHKTRRRPKGSIETFTGKMPSAEDLISTPVDTDDFGAVLVRLGERARGSFAVSQVSSGCKNRFNIEIYGTKCGVAWNQERPDELWIGHRNHPNQLIVKDPSLLHSSAAAYADLPGGHSEGYDDTHKQIFRRFYAHVADAKAAVDYPTFDDGARGMGLLEKVFESSKNRVWVDC